MPIYDFTQISQTIPATPVVGPPQFDQQAPPEMPAQRQSSHIEGGRPMSGFDPQTLPYSVEEFIIPGFRSLDAGMKHYWSGIRVPTKDSYRFMRVKIAGGDKNLMIWKDELVGGRARLPLAAIDRGSHEFNKEKYSNTKLPMDIKYPTTRGNLAIKVFRPVPFLVDYKLTIWGERKRDADYVLYQALTRFNPLAEFRIFDSKLQGTVILRYGGCQDASDKEVGADQSANVRYEISMTAEAWLPLPEVTVPTVLGQVTSLREQYGSVLESFRS